HQRRASRATALPALSSACAQAGFAPLWLPDVPPGPPGDPLFSPAFAAGQTRRLKLGTNVVPLGRNPWWLARQLAQLDRMSGGRLLLSVVPGIGPPAGPPGLRPPAGDRRRAGGGIPALARPWAAGGSPPVTVLIISTHGHCSRCRFSGRSKCGSVGLPRRHSNGSPASRTAG